VKHRGEIVATAVNESGYSKTKLAKQLGKSRQWLYDAFDNPNLSIETIIEIGKIIHVDFGYQIKATKPPVLRENTSNYGYPEDEVAYWKDKYIQLMEENKRLLQKLVENKERE
jgi:hypothetical protein